MEYHLPLLVMSEEQLAALIAKLKDDEGFQEKLKGAADLDVKGWAEVWLTKTY